MKPADTLTEEAENTAHRNLDESKRIILQAFLPYQADTSIVNIQRPSQYLLHPSGEGRDEGKNTWGSEYYPSMSLAVEPFTWSKIASTILSALENLANTNLWISRLLIITTNTCGDFKCFCFAKF